MTLLYLVIAALCIGFCLLFAAPWVEPWMTRHDQPGRLLDALEEEWHREEEPVAKDWRW